MPVARTWQAGGELQMQPKGVGSPRQCCVLWKSAPDNANEAEAQIDSRRPVECAHAFAVLESGSRVTL